MSVMNREWERVQVRTFTRWVNSHLKNGGHKEQVVELQNDLKSGILLYKLLEQIGGTRLPKINPNPKMPIHMIENLNVSLKFIQSKVKLSGTSAEEIKDGNLKMILGMIWTLILRFEIAGISVEDLNARDGLLLWCQKKTAGYPGVHVKDFTTSWRDGLAFNALIHKHRPDLLDFNSLTAADHTGNLEKAFSVAEKDLGINRFLDVNDVELCDEKPIMTYLFQFFKLFSGNQKAEMSAKRIAKLLNMLQQNEEAKQNYETKAKELLAWIEKKIPEMQECTFDNTPAGAHHKQDDLVQYQTGEKPVKAAEKLAVEGVFSTLQMKLRNNKRSQYVPPGEVAPELLNSKWNELEKLEGEKEDKIAKEIARQEKLEELVRRFNEGYAKLKAWAGEKKQYLEAKPVIDTVLTAQSQLKLLDGHNLQYDASKPRVKDLMALGEEIIAMNYRDPAAISGKMKDIEGEWSTMDTLAGEKKKWLDDELALQLRMDKLRMSFAEAATNLSRWYKDKIENLNESRMFGDSLEDVQAHKAQVDEKENTLKHESAEKKGELLKIWDEMQDLKIKDNKYTVLTVEDMNAMEKNLEEAIDKYKEAYEAEVKRQEAMEAKRKEFAAAALDFFNFLQELRKKIDELQGEPDPLVQSIGDLHQKAVPQHERLAVVKKIDAEAIAMQITHNKYTPYTVPILEGLSAALDRYVDGYVYALHEEKAKKLEYADRAAKLVAWVNETKGVVGSINSDNTLVGIQNKMQEFARYKTDTKPPKTAEKAAVLTLHDSIVKYLADSQHHRPLFEPAEGIRPDDIAALWKTLEEAERAKEEELDNELARQKQLHAWQKQFFLKATELEAWATKKDKYLQTAENPTTLQEAQTKLSQLESYAEEYAAMAPKMDEMRKLHSDLIADNYFDSAKVTSRKDQIEAMWSKLKDAEDKKREVLKADLEREQKKEQLRVEFAKQAKEFAAWVSIVKIKVEGREFGDSLEAVTAHQAVKEADDKQVTETADQKKGVCNDLWAKLQEAGVTHNAHTEHTKDTLEAIYNSLMDEIKARTHAYEKELARQQAMENKRKEFAAAAQAFVELLESHKKEIDDMSGDDPAELANQVKAKYDDGKLFEQKLAEIDRIATVAAQMEVVENKHTPHTPKTLRVKNAELKKWVMDYITELDEEKHMKRRYAKESAALVEWMEQTITWVGSLGNPDNTLAGAQAKVDEENNYRASAKALKIAERKALATLFAGIEESLKGSSHHRPQFNPEDQTMQHLPQEQAIDAKLDQLAQAEKAKEEELSRELIRQEKLQTLSKKFFTNAKDLLLWCKNKEEYLKREVGVTSVMTAKIQLDLLNVFNTEYEASKPRIEALQALNKEIVGDNFVNGAQVTTKLEEVHNLWSSLKTLADAKANALKGDEGNEVAKEDMRIEFAKLASEMDLWVRNACGEVEKYAFGNSLEEVQAHKEVKEKNDGELQSTCESKKTALDALAAKMVEAGITDNIHTTLTTKDIEGFANHLNDVIAARTASYGAELARQQAMEDKRIEFANTAKEFVQMLDTQKAAIDAVTEGEPEVRSEQVNKILESGKAALASAFEKCVEVDKQSKALQIISNKHTSYTVPILQTKLGVFEKSGQNKLAALAEEKVMKDRKLALEAEWKKKEELESLRNEYMSQSAALSQWIDTAMETISGTVKVQSVAEVETLQQEYAKVNAALPKNKELFDSLTEQAEALKAKEQAMGHEALVAKWNECNDAMKKREAWLADEHAKTSKKEAELAKFTAFAQSAGKWIDEQKSIMGGGGGVGGATTNNNPPGDDEDQLRQVNAQETAARAKADDLLRQLDQITAALKAEGLPVSRANALKQELDQVKVVVSKRRAEIEAQVMKKKSDSSLAEGELKEITEMFNSFDKDKKRALKWFEMKGALAALGDDVDDEQAKKVVAELDQNKDDMVSFEEFLQFMTKRRAYSDSAEEIENAFKDISGGKATVTAAQLSAVMDPAHVQYLDKHCPKTADGELDFGKWTQQAFV